MSLLLAIALNDSIIMASDSRTTYIYKDRVEYKDVSNKMSLMDDRICISHCGQALVNGIKIEEHLNNFISKNKNKTINKIPTLLKKYFLELDSKSEINFFVSGYYNDKPRIYKVFTHKDNELCKLDKKFIFYLGETNFVSRLFSDMFIKYGFGYTKHSEYDFNRIKENKEEAIRLVNFIMERTKEYMSFTNIRQTVGGLTEIVMIKPDKAYFYQKKL
jgi:hypothetical protein